MKTYSAIIATAAVAIAGCCVQTTVRAAGLFDSISSALGSGSAAAATSGSTAACTTSSAVSAAEGALASLAGSGTSTAASVASAVAAMIPAAPATSNAKANSYMSQLSSLATQALTAYQSHDLMKAAALYPQVQQLYSQGTSALSGLTGKEATAATDWKTKVMGVVTNTLSSLAK